MVKRHKKWFLLIIAGSLKLYGHHDGFSSQDKFGTAIVYHEINPIADIFNRPDKYDWKTVLMNFM